MEPPCATAERPLKQARHNSLSPAFLGSVIRIDDCSSHIFVKHRPPPRVGHSRTTCSKVHPGICKTQHSAHLATVLHVCRNLDCFFAKRSRTDLVGQALKFEVSYVNGEGLDDGSASVVALLADVRFAVPSMQIFVPVDNLAAEPGVVRLARRPTDPQCL